MEPTTSHSPRSAAPTDEPVVDASTLDEAARSRMAMRRATLLVADTIGEIMEFWNFKPSMGQVWTILYMSRRPLAASEIADRTGLSSGSVSMTLADLQQWGVVRREWIPGERRKLYAAETDVMAMVTRVFRERELRMIGDAISRLEEARRILDEEARSSNADAMLQSRFLATRVDNVLALARTGRKAVEQLARAGSIDLGPIKEALRRH